jgi:penicillin-insensitive murein endopeptidase
VKKFFFAAIFFFLILTAAYAQQNSAQEAQRRQDALNTLPADAAKRLFFQVADPTHSKPESIGAYGKGCLAGAEQLPLDGPNWQVMRPSRKRNFGHPKLISYIESLAARAKNQGWPGLLVGDMAQARGGPMLTGHASHQLGLEADIWLTPAPTERRLSTEEREEISAIDMVQPDLLSVYPDRFTEQQLMLLRSAASSPEVDRIFVNAAIKKAACEMEKGRRDWLRKLRPWEGHTYHFHVALKCQGKTCKNRRASIPSGDGCGKALDYWFREDVRFPKPNPNAPLPKILTLKDLPKQCSDVLRAL